MAGKIPQQFIDDLIARVDIVDLINARVPLKKAGHEFKACCPFHNEKTPSFTVSPTKQFYHCFGCGAHGTAIGFLMEFDRLEFVDAVEALAESQGLTVPREGGARPAQPNRDAHFALVEAAARFYAKQLRQHPEAGRAVDYLRRRGVSGEVARDFRIGFAPPGWHNLGQALATHGERALAELGLIQQQQGRSYDRFRDRIMFPIEDSRGRVIGFGGRVLGDGTPKYLNSPETPLFHKGRELYGLHRARRQTAAADRLLIVEGYMDVIALAQAGIANTVATLGTATTSDHIDKLFRTTGELVFCFDGDRAGRDAAWRALEVCLPHLRAGREARFLFLPDGEDPDSLVRSEGSERLLARLDEQALPLSDLLLEHLRERGGGGIAGRARLVELAQPYIAKMPAGAYRDLVTQMIEQHAGVQVAAQSTRSAAAGKQPRHPPLSTQPMIRRAVALLLQCPRLAALPDLPDAWRGWSGHGDAFLRQLFDDARQEPDVSTAVLVERASDPELRKALGRLAAEPVGHETDFEAEFRGCLAAIGKRARAQRLGELTLKGAPSRLSDKEKQELRELYGTPDTPLD